MMTDRPKITKEQEDDAEKKFYWYIIEEDRILHTHVFNHMYLLYHGIPSKVKYIGTELIKRACYICDADAKDLCVCYNESK